MKNRLAALALFCVFLTTLGACGQMGPLYLPDSNGNVITRPTRTPPTPPTPPTSPTPQAPPQR